MKKVIFSLFIIFAPLYVMGQSGSGTSSDPYFGTITSNVTWTTSSGESGTVYIGKTRNLNLTVTTGGQLTINSGVTVVFAELASNLEINGSGVLTINGTASSKVKLTKAASKANWGHVYFNTPTGTSTINHCIIDYGTSGYGTSSISGGGIYIYSASSYVTIRNTSITNCSAQYGGGISIESSSPLIENCIIYENTGAGIDVYGGSPSITNCTLVANNNSNSGEYGGIQIAAGTPAIKNCILWNNARGATTEQDYSGGGGTITYSAATQTISGTGMVDLHTTNDNAAGPNFVAPGSDNYNITSVSPCVDTGTTGGPSTDILGNTRVGTADIGAYENLDFSWQGDDVSSPTNWGTGANWNKGVIPTSAAVIIIPDVTNDPIVNENPSTPAVCASLTINSGGYLKVAAAKALTVTGTLTNNGNLLLESDATGTATIILNSYSGSGTADIKLYLTGGGTENADNFAWHYITPPVSSVATSVFTVNTLDLAQFVENRPSSDLKDGWVASDGYVYSSGLKNGPTFSTLSAGKGYNYWDGSAQTYTMSGSLITSNQSLSLSYGTNLLPGFNLLGNPFTSGLNWNDIINDVYFTFPANTSESLYFTRDNKSCSYIAGVGVPSDVNGYIPPMQGFFVKTNTSGNTITLPKDARTHTAHSRYKGSSDIPLVRLKLVKNKYSTDETVVRFDNMAKSDFDLKFDAYKMSSSTKMTLLYSQVSGTKYSINGQPFPDSFVEIPLTMNITKDTIHTISAIGLQVLENYNVTLKDLSNNFTADLRTIPDYTFSASPGLVTGRFVLNISLKTTGVENPTNTNNLFNIYPANGNINIQTLVDEWDGKQGSVRIMDLTGKIIVAADNTEFTRNSLVQVPFENRTGLYVVEIKSGLNRYTGKVVVK